MNKALSVLLSSKRELEAEIRVLTQWGNEELINKRKKELAEVDSAIKIVEIDLRIYENYVTNKSK